MLKLLLVDDHELIRAGLKQVLHAGLGNIMVGEAKNAEEAMSAGPQRTGFVVGIQKSPPGNAGARAKRSLRR
jgi:two-component system invasion response regulator UvrY